MTMVYKAPPMMTDDRPIAALILAAGESSRMKRLKPLLPLEGQTVIERVVGLFRQIGITDIRAVLGHDAERLIPVLDRQGVAHVLNTDYRSGMFSSIQAGARSLGEGCGAFFLLPADMPFVRPETLQQLVSAVRETEKIACRPRYQGRRGHPPLISAELIPAILAFDEPGGLRALLAGYEGRCVDMECDDPGTLIDLDTPEDYRKYCLPSGPIRD
jgi:molybdenum cofactor cytidylyltransferase